MYLRRHAGTHGTYATTQRQHIPAHHHSPSPLASLPCSLAVCVDRLAPTCLYSAQQEKGQGETMSKRKWKVYTTDELRDRFQPKPGSNATASDDQKVVAPNMKRRNSAPPGMIHFPPGTFSTATSSSSNNSGAQSSQHQPSNVYPLYLLHSHTNIYSFDCLLLEVMFALYCVMSDCESLHDNYYCTIYCIYHTL